MFEVISHVGINVHKKDVVVAMLNPGSDEVETLTATNEPRAVPRLAVRPPSRTFRALVGSQNQLGAR